MKKKLWMIIKKSNLKSKELFVKFQSKFEKS